MTTNPTSTRESRGDAKTLMFVPKHFRQETLSQSLRSETMPLHALVENLLDLPAAIEDKDDYICLLAHFLGLYEPLEQSLCVFGEWEVAGFKLRVPNYSSSLSNDLAVLGVDCGGICRAAHTINPDLPTFSHALGALYVLEGSALGGRFILRGLNPTVKLQVEGATMFFDRDVKTEPTWDSFRVALDSFGRANPGRYNDVIDGARRVFESLLLWFDPLRPPGGALP